MFELITIACIWVFCGIGSYSQIKTDKAKAAAAAQYETQVSTQAPTSHSNQK